MLETVRYAFSEAGGVLTCGHCRAKTISMQSICDPGFQVIERAARSVRSVVLAMPARDGMARELADAEAAQARGYFWPDEDERLRELYARYLSLRLALLDAIHDIQQLIDQLDKTAESEHRWRARLRAFLVGYLAAAVLMRSASFIVDLASNRSVVRKKLDEAEPRYGIPAKSFTAVYKNFGSYRSMWRFHCATRFYEVHAEDIASLADDREMADLIELLDAETRFFNYSRLDQFRRKWNYRLHSLKRRHVSGYKKVMFQLLKLSGRMVSEMRQPFVKAHGEGKRVTKEVVASIIPTMQAGDVLITRHDDAMSNLFLPGFWPHAALYMGCDHERAELGLNSALPGGEAMAGCLFLEAKKDGVLIRSVDETLAVDAFMVLRPRLDAAYREEALRRALSHEGKLYDFTFDFRVADRLACTEVIYRGFHGVGPDTAPIKFELKSHSGRSCISAEDLIEQALGSEHFSKVLEFGVEGESIRHYVT